MEQFEWMRKAAIVCYVSAGVAILSMLLLALAGIDPGILLWAFISAYIVLFIAGQVFKYRYNKKYYAYVQSVVSEDLRMFAESLQTMYDEKRTITVHPVFHRCVEVVRADEQD